MMMSFLEVMWRITVVDVEATLRAACHKVLYDTRVDAAARLTITVVALVPRCVGSIL